jgi:hypothetical protein
MTTNRVDRMKVRHRADSMAASRLLPPPPVRLQDTAKVRRPRAIGVHLRDTTRDHRPGAIRVRLQDTTRDRPTIKGLHRTIRVLRPTTRYLRTMAIKGT